MNFTLLTAAFLVLFSPALRADTDACEEALKPAFWSQSRPHVLSSGQPLTYAFDSELKDSDVFAFLSRTEAGRALLERKYGARSYSLAELAKLARVSEKQLKIFGLKREVDRSQSKFALTDLNPKSMAAAVAGKREGLSLYLNRARGWLSPPEEVAEVESELRADGLPVRTHLDYSGLQVEVTHESYEISASLFLAIVKEAMHGLFELPQTHLHLGIPAEVTAEQAHAIARAVETRIILGWAAGTDQAGAPLRYYRGSSLRSDVKQAELRGAIRLQLLEWSNPVPMHNLEIRQWETIEGGLELLALAGNLAEEHGRLRILSDFDATPIDDPYTANLNGALKYAGRLLLNDPRPEIAEVGMSLLALAGECEAAGTITPQLRKKTYKLLKDRDVLSLLEKAVFLQ